MVASGLRNVVPLSGSTRPAAILSSVDLPDPLRPTRHRRSPAETIRSTPSKSGVPPKVSAMPPSWSSGAANSTPDRRERVPVRTNHLSAVMPALVAGIHAFPPPFSKQNVDGRDKPGHDSEMETASDF